MRTVSVSYTHLDVYKRQDYGNTNGILEGQVAQTDRNLESQGIVLHIVVDDNIVTVFDILLQIIQLAVLNFCGPAGCFLVSPLGTAVGIVQNIGGGLRSLYSDLSQTCLLYTSRCV